MRIGVVGAGPAGLATAMYLRERGVQNVTVLERLDRIGGKCCTVSFGGIAFDMGANYLTPGYRRTLRLAKEVGCTTHPAPRRKAFDVATGVWHSLIAAVTSGENPLAFGFATLRYLWKSWRLRAFAGAPGFVGVGAMPELHMSFGKWLDENGMSSLRRLFAVPIEVFGYGYLDDVPVPYVLKYMTTMNFLVVLAVGAGLPVRWPKQFDEGYQHFWERIIEAKGIDVRTGVLIESVDRRGTVTVTTNQGAFEFDELVIACPPAKILDVTVDRTRDEEELFSVVHHRDYWVTATEPRGVPNHLIDELQLAPAPTLPPKGHPWGMSKMYADSDVVLYYSLVDGELDDQLVDARIRSDTQEMGAIPGPVLAREKWDTYFPHVGPTDLAAQWYERAEAMQGRRHTWYSGGLFAFELIEPILGYADNLAKRIVDNVKQDRIAVVGAGAGGLSAAWYLRAAGYGNVTVLEAADTPGGKCDTLMCDGLPVDLGAFTVSPAYKQTMRIARDVGAGLTVQPPRLAWESEGRIRPIRQVLLRDVGILRLLWAGVRYVFQLWRLRSVLDPPGFGGLNSSPACQELCDPFETWLRRHRLTALEDMFEMVVPDMGYGELGNVPTVYVLKYIGLGNFTTLSMVGLGLTRRWPKRFALGFGSMWERVAETLDVRTGVEITEIERSEGGVVIQTVEDGERRTHAFDRLVIACPIDHVISSLCDPTPDETYLAERVTHCDYRVIVAQTKGVPNQIIDAVHELRGHRPWEILQPWPGLDRTVFYVSNPGRDRPSDLEHHLRESLHDAYPEATLDSFLVEKCWRYFPHFNEAALKDGAYERFERIQGANRTVYVGGLLAFETVETTVQYSKAAIEAHFGRAP
jgi:protoporphyrinogen oxidase